MKDILDKLSMTVRTTQRDLESSLKGNDTRTVIVHPRLGKDEAEAKMMADDTPTPNGKWKGWLYREIQTELERVDFGRLPQSANAARLPRPQQE